MLLQIPDICGLNWDLCGSTFADETFADYFFCLLVLFRFSYFADNAILSLTNFIITAYGNATKCQPYGDP